MTKRMLSTQISLLDSSFCGKKTFYFCIINSQQNSRNNQFPIYFEKNPSKVEVDFLTNGVLRNSYLPNWDFKATALLKKDFNMGVFVSTLRFLQRGYLA